MSAADFKRVEELFHQAVARPAIERGAFLAAACAGDAALLVAVEALLEHDREGDTFLVSPVAGAAAQHREVAPTLPVLGQAAALGSPLPCLPWYEVLEELGRGGMGVVYKARQTRLDRLVAVKMLLPASPVTAEQLARFRVEAEALARLNHPNIVAIYDVGEHEGQPYFVLEYVPGPSLAQVLAGRPQDALASARLIETVARAIHAVHACGIIHRDLKPANILLAGLESGESGVEEDRLPADPAPLTTNYYLFAVPKITDFGLAKDRIDLRKLTQTGVTLGTPCYMAPEQVANSRIPVDPATDIYALGSILYEMLVGRPPFDGDTLIETVLQLLRDEPLSPAVLRPSLPRDLVTICLKCLEKSPRRRYASAGELADDLHRFRNGEPIRARPVRAAERAYRWCRRRPLVTGLLTLIGTLAVAFVVTVLFYNARLQTALDRLEAQSEIQRQQIVQLNVHIGVELLESGDSFAALLRFVEALRLDEHGPETAEHRSRIATILQHGPRLTELLDLESPVLGAAVDAAGGFIATVGADHTVTVWQVPARRRIATGLAHPDVPIRAALSADGRLLGTVTVGGAARIWDLSTGKARILPTGIGPAVERLVFHPNGRLLLTEHADARVRIWYLTTAEPRLVARDVQSAPVFAVPSSDGWWLFTADADNHGQLWDVATGQPTCPALALADPVRQAAVSADGHRVAVVGTARGVRVWDAAAGRPVGKALSRADDGGRVTLSPDGRRLFACDASGAGRLWDVETAQARTPRLRHGSPLVCAGIDAAGDRIVTVGQNGVVGFWELGKSPSDAASRPVADLLALAQVHAGGCLDERHAFLPLSAARLRATWEGLHPARPRRDR